MTEAKTNLWAKAWRRTWIDDASIELDLCAIALRQYLAQHVGRVDDDGTGWATTESGAPVTPARMAIVLKTPLAAVHASLDLLRSARIAVECGGEWGTLRWLQTQETPEATRTRRHRAAASVTSGVTVTVAVTPKEPAAVTATVTETTRRAEEQKSRLTTLPYTAGGREESSPAAEDIAARNHSAPGNPTADAVTAPIGRRLADARLAVFATTATAAPAAGMTQGRLKNLEAGVLLPDPDDLQRLARAYGQPEISGWSVPVRDLELVADLVKLHHDRAVELGAKAPGSPATATPLLAASVYATEADDIATGLTLRQAWERVITRGAEELRRDIARGKTDQIHWFTLANLAGERRRPHLLAAADLDRRDDGPGRSARRGPPPPQNPDRLTDGEIPQ